MDPSGSLTSPVIEVKEDLFEGRFPEFIPQRLEGISVPGPLSDKVLSSVGTSVFGTSSSVGAKTGWSLLMVGFGSHCPARY